MRRALRSAVVVTWLAACTSYAGGGSPEDAGADAGLDATPPAPPPGDAAGLEAAADADADAAAPGGQIILVDDFESSVACNGWEVVNVTAATTTGDAHGGTHACRVCPTAPGTSTVGYIRRIVPFFGTGSYTLLYYVRSGEDGGAAASWSASVLFQDDDGATAGSGNQGAAGGAYTIAQVNAVASSPWQSILVGLFTDNVHCLYVDDVSFAKDP